jgi:hypothetical protein
VAGYSENLVVEVSMGYAHRDFCERVESGADPSVALVDEVRLGQARLDFWFLNCEWRRLFGIFGGQSDSGVGTILLQNVNIII